MAQVLSAIVSECIPDQLRSKENMKAPLLDITNISSHFTSEYAQLVATHTSLAILKTIEQKYGEGGTQSNLDCQTLQG